MIWENAGKCQVRRPPMLMHKFFDVGHWKTWEGIFGDQAHMFQLSPAPQMSTIREACVHFHVWQCGLTKTNRTQVPA